MVSDQKYWFEKEDDLFSENREEGGAEEKTAVEPKKEEVKAEEISLSIEQKSAENTEKKETEEKEVKEEKETQNQAQIEPKPEEKKMTEEDFFKALSEDSKRANPQPMVATKSKRGFGEPENPVRKKMLKKLLKYEYRALFKFLLPAYLCTLGLAFLFGIGLFLSVRKNFGSETIVRLLIGVSSVYIFAIVGVSITCVVNIAKRYYTNLFSGEGYLTFSIPATPEEHILSKLIGGLSTIVLTVLVSVLSLMIVDWSSGSLIGFSELFSAIGRLFTRLTGIHTAHAIALCIEGLLFLLLFGVMQLQIVYSCICVGQLFVTKDRKSMGGLVFALYIGVTHVLSMFTPILSIVSALSSIWGIHLLLWIMILGQAGLSVGAFFLQRYIIKNKLNLA